MNKNSVLVLVGLCMPFYTLSQTIPDSRTADWSLAGSMSTVDYASMPVQYLSVHGLSDSSTPSDNVQAYQSALSKLDSTGGVLYLPAGEYVFDASLRVPSGVYVVGSGADETTVVFDISGNQNGFVLQGSIDNAADSIKASITRGQTSIELDSAQRYQVGDWIKIMQDDSQYISNTWAAGHIAQICQITAIQGTQVMLNNAVRMDIPLTLKPYVRRVRPCHDAGISCLSIRRQDSSSIGVRSNIFLKLATNCLIENIHSQYCKYGHISAEQSAYLTIRNSHFEQSFDYGGGGNGYGVTLHLATSDCLVENNLFDHLRHAMLVQAGANGNVFTYNFSRDAYRTEFPSDGAGDIVCHGNYPFANLFEHNICDQMLVDNSHGPNGPYNTYFRNRAVNYGIRVTDPAVTSLNFVGNEITNTSFPQSMVNYSIPSGQNHLTHGNNHQGTIKPTGTTQLPEQSYYYSTPPDMASGYFASIGTPNTYKSGSVRAQYVYDNDLPIQDCSATSVLTVDFDIEVLTLTQSTEGVLARWEVHTAPADARFLLYKKIEDNWKILTAQATGKRSYSYLDADPELGSNLYKLSAEMTSDTERVLDIQAIDLSEIWAEFYTQIYHKGETVQLDELATELILVDALGSTVKQKSQTREIALSGLPEGVYYLRYHSPRGNYKMSRIIVSP